MHDRLAHWSFLLDLRPGIYQWVGFLFLLVDFCVSGVPVRLLHIVQPLAFALLYNICLLIVTAVTQRRGPFYSAADYFSHDTGVSMNGA